MGQAKNRGSFEERKTASIAANKERIEALERIKAINEANMTPEQRQNRQRTQKFVAMATGLAMGGFGSF